MIKENRTLSVARWLIKQYRAYIPGKMSMWISEFIIFNACLYYAHTHMVCIKSYWILCDFWVVWKTNQNSSAFFATHSECDAFGLPRTIAKRNVNQVEISVKRTARQHPSQKRTIAGTATNNTPVVQIRIEFCMDGCQQRRHLHSYL